MSSHHLDQPLTRRGLLAAAGALGLGLAACGESEYSAPARKPAASSGSFPARVPHKYGTKTVERAPKRVATC